MPIYESIRSEQIRVSVQSEPERVIRPQMQLNTKQKRMDLPNSNAPKVISGLYDETLSTSSRHSQANAAMFEIKRCDISKEIADGLPCTRLRSESDCLRLVVEVDRHKDAFERDRTYFGTNTGLPYLLRT